MKPHLYEISILLTISSNRIHVSTLCLSPFKYKPKKKDFLFLSFSWVWWYLILFLHSIDKIAKPLSHPSFIPHWKLDFFFQLFAKYSLILFCRDFILKQFLFSSKSELRFNQLVVLPLGNRFLFTEDISRSIRIQHIELEHYMYFTYEHIHSFYTIPQCGQGGSWSALYPPIKNTKIYVCFTGMWVGFC